MADEEEAELSEKQKKEIAKWFLLNSPPGEIQFVAKDVKAVINDDVLYGEAASEAFPLYNKSHLISIEMPGRIGDVIVTSYGELGETEFIDPRTAQVAVVDHIKQVCTEVRPALDEELPSAYVEEFRCALDAEILKYVGEAYPKGVCSVYCGNGKDMEGPGFVQIYLPIYFLLPQLKSPSLSKTLRSFSDLVAQKSKPITISPYPCWVFSFSSLSYQFPVKVEIFTFFFPTIFLFIFNSIHLPYGLSIVCVIDLYLVGFIHYLENSSGAGNDYLRHNF